MNALKYRAKARGKPVVLLYFHPQGDSLRGKNPTSIYTRLSREGELD